MIRGRTDAGGVEEWECPICGRRVLLRWPPRYLRTVVERGDQGVAHTGGSGVRFTAAGVEVAPVPDDRDWLAGLGIRWDEPEP